MTLAKCAEAYLGDALRGLVVRDWSLIGEALRRTAVKYHNENSLDLHPGIDKIGIEFTDRARVIVSAAIYAVEKESGGIV